MQSEARGSIAGRNSSGLGRLGDRPPTGVASHSLRAGISSAAISDETDLVPLPTFGLLQPTPEARKRRLLALAVSPVAEGFSVGIPLLATTFMPPAHEEISRGLIDVLPDEASLAMVLAHELGHIVLGHNVDTKYSFSDRLMTPDEKLLRRLDLKRSREDEEAADAKALVLLRNSPHKDRLSNAGLFLEALEATESRTPELLGTHLGNRVIERRHQLRMVSLMTGAPKIEQDKLDQIAALPLGARIKIDPWTDRVELMKAKSIALVSPREKKPVEVTPLIPCLTRFGVPRPEQQARR